jgi:AcrR family transcriptional regulator
VILDAARRLFAEKGFDTTTVRAIATSAEVDPALVHHYFGSKDQLFLAAMKSPFDPREFIPQITAGGPDQVGVRLVRTFVTMWDGPIGNAGAALFRSAMSNEWSARLLREFLTTQILRRVLADLRLDPAEAPIRASLIATQMAGLAMIRYIIKLEPIASMPVEQLVRLIAPNVQNYITGPLEILDPLPKTGNASR